MTKRRITAGELVAQLQGDPVFQAAQRKRDAARDERARFLERAERPLVAALRRAGVAAQSVWDLVNTTNSYVSVLPILIEHLGRPYPPLVREGIARALAIHEARFAWSRLRELYLTESDCEVKDGLAVALAGAAGEDEMAALLALVEDPRNGESRILFLRSIAARMPEVLPELAKDPALSKEARFLMRVARQTKRRSDRDQ